MFKSFKTKSLVLLLALIGGGNLCISAQSDYSTDYTGNIKLSTTGGTSATSAKVIINNTEYNAIKAGTGNVAGAVRIVVPAGTKYLHLHAAGWNGENVSLQVTGVNGISNIGLTSDTGISGNTPFTISSSAILNNFYKVITFSNALSGETYLTFTATGGKRFVVWGVTAEEEGSTLANSDLALSGAPVGLSFDLYDNATAQTVSFTTSSTGAITISESEYVTTSISGNTVTVTPIKVTPSTQTITISQAADANFKAGSVTFTVDVDDSTPFTGATVTFNAGTDTGSTEATGPDQITKSVVDISSTSAAFATVQYRLYSGSNTTISTTTGIITNIVFTESDTKYSVSNLSTETGTYSNGTWTGNAKRIVFNASSQVRVDRIVVTVVPENQKYTLTIGSHEHINLHIFDDPNGTEPLASGAQVPWGTTIYLSPDPADGYELDEITVTKSDNTTVTLSEAEGGMQSFVMPESNVTISATASLIPIPQNEYTWILTDLADLTANDVFVIVGNNGNNYAMTNNNGTGNPPAATAVTIESGKITSYVGANIQWTVSGNATNGYTFYPNGSSTTWLYCNNSNNGVRVGNNTNKTFKIINGYLKHDVTSRYVGIYNSQDWRCYESDGTNIANQTFSFYKRVDVANVTNIGWATYITKHNVQFAEGDAYVVTNLSNDGATTIQGVTSVPANTPVLLKSAGEKVASILASAPTAPTKNLLKIARAGTTIPNNCYVLSYTEADGVGFYHWAGTTAMTQDRVYLQPAEGFTPIFIGINPGGENGIENVSASSAENSIFDLQGRSVAHPTKGLYIVNGKKVVIK